MTAPGTGRLKGGNNPAQGNALGIGLSSPSQALKGRESPCAYFALSGLEAMRVRSSQGVAPLPASLSDKTRPGPLFRALALALARNLFRKPAESTIKSTSKSTIVSQTRWPWGVALGWITYAFQASDAPGKMQPKQALQHGERAARGRLEFPFSGTLGPVKAARG
jgi:hypothetical protein